MEQWSRSTCNEFSVFMLGELIGEGMSRKVYQHPFDPTKVIKVEDSVKYFQNVREWEIWNDFKHAPEVAKWLAPCHAISHSGTFLIMERAVDLPTNKKIEKLPEFLTDHKIENFGMIGNRVVARDYGRIVPILETRLRKWRHGDKKR